MRIAAATIHLNRQSPSQNRFLIVPSQSRYGNL